MYKRQKRMILKRLSIIVLICILLSLTTSTVATAAYNPTAYFFGLGLAMCLLLIVLPLIIAILACIWIYKDAEKRGKSGAIWVILLIVASLIGSFIGFVIVIIVWLAIRPPIGEKPIQSVKQDRHCTSCGRPIPLDARICPYCGKKFW